MTEHQVDQEELPVPLRNWAIKQGLMNMVWISTHSVTRSVREDAYTYRDVTMRPILTVTATDGMTSRFFVGKASNNPLEPIGAYYWTEAP